MVAKDGRLVIVLTTNRHVYPGEELTMDYYSITTSDIEWRAAVCLCGMTTCRGSFLHYATQDDLQQVLNQNCGPVWRYASLLHACSSRPLKPADVAVLERHGIKAASLGSNPPKWMLKYIADNLKFVEFERKALPCALLRKKDGSASMYSYSAADLDARSVMEQRIQSMICCVSMIRRVIDRQPRDKKDLNPIQVLSSTEACERVWKILLTIPDLMVTSSKSNSHIENARPPAITSAIDEIRTILSVKATSLLVLRKVCLDIRQALLRIAKHGSLTARYGQLADVLVLWAYTNNFSSIQDFEVVESAPITVLARELGTNIPRMKIFKPESFSKRIQNAMKKDVDTVGKRGQDSDEVRSQSSTPSLPLPSSEAIPGRDSVDLLSTDAIDATKNLTIDDGDSPTNDLDTSMGTATTIESNLSEPQDPHDDDIDNLRVADTLSETSVTCEKRPTREMTLSPDEPVHMASKVYDKKFMFWQVRRYVIVNVLLANQDDV